MGYTLINISKPAASSKRKQSYWKLWLVGILVLLAAGFLRWGGYLLVARGSMPEHVDAAVVLQGSIASEKARIATAMAMLQQGSATRVAISVPRESYWGQEVTPIARQYLEKNFGRELAGRVDFCDTDPDMNSAQQEAQALTACVQVHGWKTITLVTSNYQTRRVGMIWRKTLLGAAQPVDVSVEGVADAGYQPRGWWRQGLSAEIWVKESTKLVWASL